MFGYPIPHDAFWYKLFSSKYRKRKFPQNSSLIKPRLVSFNAEIVIYFNNIREQFILWVRSANEASRWILIKSDYPRNIRLNLSRYFVPISLEFLQGIRDKPIIGINDKKKFTIRLFNTAVDRNMFPAILLIKIANGKR